MKTEEHLLVMIEKASKARASRDERLKRKVESGYLPGKILANGAIVITKPKGIQNWYDTKTLVKLVSEAMDRNGSAGRVRCCHINGKWRLQIRGKHLRRLLKARPDWKCTGRMIVEK